MSARPATAMAMTLATVLSTAIVASFAAPAAMAQQHDHAAHDDRPTAQTPPAHDHSTMDHSTMDHSRHRPQGTDVQTPHTPIPPITDADREAAKPPLHGHAHGERVMWKVTLDRLEGWREDGGGQAWEAQAWIGTDAHRLWVRSGGEREAGRTHAADVEVLYGRPIGRWWDLVAGARQESRPGPSRTAAAVGVMGVAPYKFEVEATAYLDNDGRLSAKAEAEYDVLLTNRLILQPAIEAEWHARDDRERGIGAGLSKIETGLRLRYEITRKFAPYVGLVHERGFGGTADLLRDEGESTESTKVVAGIRFWF
ncbi:MAG: copper resistance protein B [Pseudomonadota bacterium]